MSFATGTRRSVRFALRAAAGLSLLFAASASAQVPGQNVNMVSGTGWPEGDPFLQRQNEPSCAVSTANPRHVLCGANDYRTVDLPGLPDGEETGDAWLGVFKSLDGAQTWKSTLLPGYPQDQSFEGLASPTHGLAAAADPVVRSGPGGIFYYTGIAFNRGTNVGKIFVSRFVDLNNNENGAAPGTDPVRYVDAIEIDSGTSGQFLDKPWSAVGLPTAGTSTCVIPVSSTETRTVPAAPVYFAWAKFTGAQSSKIMFTRSLDCGVTWSNPVKLSESSSVNQGTTVAVDPVTGYVYVAWRRFLASNQTDAILIARSTDGGQTFPNKDVRPIATIAYPFDQGVTGTRFRTNALPTIAASVNAAGTRSWVHVAWSQRSSATADSRIVMTTSADGVTWPAARVVDASPVADDYGGSFTSGHQFMPQLSFAGGKLMLLYYDQRLDHTLGLLQPNQPFAPDVTGRFYKEQRVPRGELLAGPGGVFTPFVDEAGLTQIRHTLDLRVAQADVTPLDSAPATDPGSALAFSSARVSEYIFGTRGDETDPETIPDGKGGTIAIVEAGEVKRLRQLQVNPPNLPIFRKGTLPFIGDYVDLVALQFVPDPAKPGGWAFNTAPSRSPVFYATWTSNQDVRPPAALNPDGSYDWSAYTPPFVPELGTQSLFDPAQARPECVTGNEGTRNQNVYVSAISQGLEVSSPQNVKALSQDVHAFVVTVRNATDKKKAFELRLADIPAGVGASFRNDPGYGPLDGTNTVNPAALQKIQVEIPARSGISRSVFVRLAGSASLASSLRVDVAELASSYGLSCLRSTSCVLDPSGLTGTVRFNPPGSAGVLTQPSAEVYDAQITPLELNTTCAGSANVTSANVTSPNCLANVTSANVTSANVTSFHIANPDLANVTSANVTSANVTSANVTSANVTSQPIAANVTSANVTSANVTSSPISDATYTLTNTGNTAHSYHVKIVSNTTVTQPLQLVLSKTYTTPLGLGCALVEEPHALVQTNVDNVTPAIQLLGGVNPDPNIPDPQTTNATVALAPGESAQVTIRGRLDVAPMAELATHIAPVVIPHAGGGAFATVLLVASSPGSLGSLQVGVPYAGQLTAIGGSGTYAWSLVKGPLPPGLTLGGGGDLTGTPTQGGTWTFTVGVQDPVTQQTAEQTLTLGVAPGQATVLTTTSPSPSYAGQLVTFTVAVTPSSTASGLPVPTGTVTLQYGSQTATGSLGSAGTAQFQATFAASGSYSVTATYGGDASYAGATQTFTLYVRAVNATSTALASTANPSVWGQPVTITASVTSGGGTPTGSVTFAEGATVLATQALVGGSASFTSATLSVATHTVTASYASSSPAFAGGSSATVSQVVTRADTTTTLTSSKNPSVWLQSVTFTATVAAKAPGAGTPAGTVTFYDGMTVLGTGTVSSGKATYTTTTLTAASHSLTAAYGGDTNFKGSTSTAVSQVVGSAYRFVGFQTPLKTAGTLDAPTVSGSWTFSRVLPIKWQLFDATTGASITRLDTTKTLTALRAGNTCPSAATGGTVVLYTPTQGAAGGSTYRSSSSGYTFNWDATKNATKGCYWLKLDLDDGTTKVTEVQLN